MQASLGASTIPGNTGEPVAALTPGSLVQGSQAQGPLAIEAIGLVKRFDGVTAVSGVDLAVPEGAIYGVLGPNGAGKTTTLRMLLGIIDPDAGVRRVFGHERPHDIARLIGYLPEERGLYPSMKADEAIAFLGALRGVPLAEGRRRGRELLEEHGLGHAADLTIRQLSKGMAQTVQLLGTLVHRPRLVVLDEPFSGLDALNQGKLERMIRALAAEGTTVIFSTHVIAHAERLCEGVAIIAGGKVPYAGSVDTARDRIPAQVRLETKATTGAWRAALPADARREGDIWHFSLPDTGIEPLLRALIEGEAGILSLSIERAGLHDAFVHIAGEAAARALEEAPGQEPAR
ncbi:ATP-binding cassette domain-containing protein [Altererythrobacter aerius]|uniref:ATP-binding cassette domain-containing protein n=1 Tax=Tsuneonella aeria TaxID=1837929 RepID=A0A6I4TD67_9SPHN|nr:ATP-binding cassette domain-containing protein [Tsuneonella aeria]MXO75519.1 ATP-binding cassette domain-containing protein [Tsuneonella aeria]